MLVLLACSEEQEATVPFYSPTNVPQPMGRAAGSTTRGAGATAPSGETPETTSDEGVRGETPETISDEGVHEEIDLVAQEPEGVEPPAEAERSEQAEPAEEVQPEPALAIPAIGQPGYPMGSSPRLVPVELVGPVTGLPVRFNVYLPPGYDSGTASYPVVYDLHGLTDSRDTNPGPVIRSLEAAMRNGVVGPLMVVFPQGFVEGYWADSLDRARPSETQVIHELIPYVDESFRTLAHRARRGVSGFSMGGFGALAYAVKYPERFRVGIGYDSALDTWDTLVGRRAYIADAAFGNDESYFDQISPWANAVLNAPVLVESSTLRGVPGLQYRDFHEAFRDHLAMLGIPYDHVQTDCGHDYSCLLDREGENSWAILQREFGQPAAADEP